MSICKKIKQNKTKRQENPLYLPYISSKDELTVDYRLEYKT